MLKAGRLAHIIEYQTQPLKAIVRSLYIHCIFIIKLIGRNVIQR